ncbi:hypothetical protein D9619_008386 [Psilocybe cf. subviscida]|uniref:Fungal N-terminal domain-containing protein n=1 Tax=Psilocybe cf. subviscida TaxID=2480587 RepID=A0A8H5F0M4_9AGAR|nr:hypothetical protein D9619_008386 [Psilocybe cf. subviscida]
MDPLSVALAIVSLATAVKDMVELGQKIHESFAKVSSNLCKAQRVAEEIKDMVEKIEVFYQDHQDVLDNMKNFHLALQGLLGKFRNFETTILPLLPQMGGRKRNSLIRGWDAWRNNSKVEGSILELQSDIVKVMLDYMMKSAMRNEVKLEAVHQETSRGLEVLEVVRRDVSALRITTATSYESSGRMTDEFDRSVIMFAKSTPSTSAPMLRAPNVITEELMTTAYIKLQVNTIVTTLEKMLKLPVLKPNSIAQAPDSIEEFHLDPMLEQALMSITRLRHHVVRQVTNIRDLLETARLDINSVLEGTVVLNELATGLQTLGLGHESTLVGNWAITLARTLVDASGGKLPHLDALLALCLFNQSIQYRTRRDQVRNLIVIEEAHTIAQNLRSQHSGQAHFQILYSEVLLQYAWLVDSPKSIGMFIEAAQVLEDITGVQAFTRSDSLGHVEIEGVVEPDSSFLDRLFSSAPSITAILNYARALQDLGTYLFIDGNTESALRLVLLAMAICRNIVSIYGQEYRGCLAIALSGLVLSRAARCIPKQQLVNMADECIELLRELTIKNPPFYARGLIYVLWEKARALRGLNRNAEVIATWEEIAGLAGQIVQDSKLCAAALRNLSDQFRDLKKHDEAARTGTLAITTHQEGAETQALRYLYLSKDLQQLQRYKESTEAARTSLAQYRYLAMREPKTWMGDVSRALSVLAHCLAASGDYSEALITWKESMSVLGNLLNTNPDEVNDMYLTALHTSYVLEDEDECLDVCSTAVRYLRQLSETHPQNAAMTTTSLSAEYSYTYNLLRLGRLQNAEQYIDRWLDVWRRKPEAISESDNSAFYASKLYLKAIALDGQGCTKQALLATGAGQDVVKLFFGIDRDSSSQMIYLMVQEAQLRINLGDYEEALRVAEGALQLCRGSKADLSVDCLVWSLYVVALTASSCWNYARVVEAAREGCNIFASQEGVDKWKSREDGEEHVSMRPSLLAFLSFAEANLGRCSTAVEYAHCAVDASLDIRDMKMYISATTAEQSYMETRGYLADILLAIGDLSQARLICEERRAYFSKRVEKRMGEYRDLAPILRMQGILCCTEGLHEEGDAAAQELSRIMKTLGSAFPSLQEQVKIRLRHQAKVPILKVLDDMSKKLDCGHQAEVLSLFAN